jgi:hypothetical protein
MSVLPQLILLPGATGLYLPEPLKSDRQNLLRKGPVLEREPPKAAG